MRSVGETQGSIQVLVHDHLATRQRRPPAHPLDLQAQILKAHRVVAVDAALELQREDPFQITTPTGHKGVSTLRRADLKTAIELGDVVLRAESGWPSSRVASPASAQLLRQAALPGPEAALAAPARLRRVGRDHLHAQLLQRPAHLRQPLRIDLPPSLRGEQEMAAAIAVQRAEQPLRSITSRSAAITVRVDSSSTSCA